MSKDSKTNPIDKEKTIENPGLSEIPHHIGSSIVKPEDQGKIRSRSINSMHHQTDLQMKQIYDQMQLLAEQANKINERKVVSEIIYQSEIRFEPLINHIYYLYNKNQTHYFLSMISPKQWNKEHLDYMATVKLLADYTWEVIEKSNSWEINA